MIAKGSNSVKKLRAPLPLTLDLNAVSALNHYLETRALVEAKDGDDSEGGINLYLAYLRAAYELAKQVALAIEKSDDERSE
ncbi:hypothetical protein AB3464_05860 [Pseudomonas asplenii]|uniref:hypothetical protein n=1 Tax=Pseudomonas asplenii TaxID=53407 RepID=UPI0037CC352D